MSRSQVTVLKKEIDPFLESRFHELLSEIVIDQDQIIQTIFTEAARHQEKVSSRSASHLVVIKATCV